MAGTMKQLPLFQPAPTDALCDGWSEGFGDCGNPPREPHTCPYREEIAGDFDTLCNRCEGCESSCAMEI